MKAKFFALVALVLGLASCQNDPEGLNVSMGGEVLTTVNVGIPESETRAGGVNSAQGAITNIDLENTDYTLRYIFQVFDENGTASKDKQVKFSDDTDVAFEVRLVPERKYTFVVWADIVEESKADDTQPFNYADYHYNTANFPVVAINENTWVAMDETRDAFTGKATETSFTSASDITVTLTRPFAKLRVVTTDMASLGQFNIVPHNAVVTYKTDMRTSFNAFEGLAEGASLSNKTHTYDIASYGETGNERTIFADYFFADNDVVKFEMRVNEEGGRKIAERFFNTDINVKRNYLTTLKGAILTDGGDVNVELKPGLGGSENPDIDYTVITSGSQIQDAINNGGSYMLGSNIYVASTRASLFAATRTATTTNICLNGYAITFADNATITVPAGKTLVITDEPKEDGTKGAIEVSDNAGFVNEGTIILEGGNIDEATIENKAGATVEITDGSISNNVVKGNTDNVTNYVDNLKAAFANGGEYALEADVVLVEGLTLAADSSLVLDLNGKSISQTNAQTSNYQMILNDGNLTIIDSAGGGKLSYADTGKGGNFVSNVITNRGTLTVNGGTIENVSSAEVADNGFPYAIDTSIWGEATEVVVNINGGTITSIYSPLRVRADSTTKNVVANITGGVINGRIDHQMSSSTAGVLGTLNISGGTFNAYGVTSTALQVFGSGEETDASGIKLNITGGTFNAPIKIYRGQYVPLGKNFNEKFISGGTFSDFAVVNNLAENASIAFNCDINNAPSVSVPVGTTAVIDLGGHTITAVDETTVSYGLINNRGNLTIKNGTLKLSATNDNGWSRYSSVVSNNPGGNLTVNEDVTIEHLGGTAMSYGIDNLTNGKGTSAITYINGATVKSKYIAVRQFLNGVEATNELYVNSGELDGKYTIYFQDPSENANTGKLVVEADAALNSSVYLGVTEGSTEWPVEVSVAAAALKNGATVVASNVPAGYGVIVENGVWKVVKSGVNKYVVISNADELISLSNVGVKNGEKVFVTADIDLEGKEFNGIYAWNFGGHNVFDGQGYTISNWTYEGGAADMGFIRQWVGPVSNINFDNCHLKTAGRSAIAAGKIYGNITNIHINNSSIEDSYWACGAIAGLYNAGSIENCTVTNTTVKSNGGTGGIVGVINEEGGTRAVRNCTVSTSTIHNTGAYGSVYSGGGIVGLFNAGDNAVYEIVDCKVVDCKLEGGYIYEVSPEF